jgi:hypothetical protein
MLWIIFDFMFLQEREKLVLVRTLAVVFGLAVNVSNRVITLCDSDAECTVSFLP